MNFDKIYDVVKEKNRWVQLAISDSGPGIPSDQIEKIFEPLYTTKAKGIGFGLSIVKMIVERHKGDIEIISNLSEGTTFILSFPMVST